MERAYRYRLYPNTEQREHIERHFGAVRWVYNYGLEKKTVAYRQDKTNISCFELSAELPSLKDTEETAWLNDINAQSLQYALRQLDNAYTKFFRKQANFPKFKSRHRSRLAFTLPQGNRIDFDTGRAKFVKLGVIKVRVDRPFVGSIVKATISRDVDRYFVSYTVRTPEKEKKPKRVKEATTIGIDLGLKDFIVLSTGDRVAPLKALKSKSARLAVLQRRLSRKVKGSANRNKARIRVAKCHQNIRNQRSDWLHKLTHKLTHENQVDSYAMETLRVSNMMKNHCLAKSISDASWGEFARQMEYKCRWYGKNLIRIGTFEPSSKMCACGIVNRKLTLGDRLWVCASCGRKNDRDLVAAQNIKAFALK